jgi:class 3 adenylate cyclase
MDNEKKENTDTANFNVEELLGERERLDKLFKDKFTRIITVMFTDLKGSTAFAEKHGDLAHRTLIKNSNGIVLPIIKKYGTLVKTMGDGTMSYYENPSDALRAGVEIQREIDNFNLEKKLDQLILIRVGIHTGQGIVEDNDIFGDVVNVASRFEAQAHASEIYFSEETYNALEDKSEIYCRYITETTIKGKEEPVKIYKAFWNPKEVELDLQRSPASPTEKMEEKKKLSLPLKLALFIIPILIILSIIFFGKFSDTDKTENRSKQHSIVIPEQSENKDDVNKPK